MPLLCLLHQLQRLPVTVPRPVDQEAGPVDGAPLPLRVVGIKLAHELPAGELSADPAVHDAVLLGAGEGPASAPEGPPLHRLASRATRLPLADVPLALAAVEAAGG